MGELGQFNRESISTYSKNEFNKDLGHIFTKAGAKWNSILDTNGIKLSMDFGSFCQFIQSDFHSICNRIPYFSVLISEQVRTLDSYYYHNINHIIFMIFGYYVMKDIHQKELDLLGFLGEKTDQIMILSILIHDAAIPVFSDLDADEKRQTSHEDLAVERLKAIENLLEESGDPQEGSFLPGWNRKMFVAVSQIVLATKMNFNEMRQNSNEVKKTVSERITLADISKTVLLCIDLICDLDRMHLAQKWETYLSSEQGLFAELTKYSSVDRIRFIEDSVKILAHKFEFLTNDLKFGWQRGLNTVWAKDRIKNSQTRWNYANL